MGGISRLRWEVAAERKRLKLKRVHERFREFTMIGQQEYVSTLQLIDQLRELPGCVIECGVWRGGMSAGIATILGPDRQYFLFDSFEGLPKAEPIDGPAAIRWQENTTAPAYYDNCAAGQEFAERAMALAGAKFVTLVKGWFNETLPKFKAPEPIAVLRLDGDWYESTMVCLQNLFDLVAPGGLILIDDYYTWDGCSRAVHDYLSRKSAVERIQSLRNVCFIEKRDPKNPSATRFTPLTIV